MREERPIRVLLSILGLDQHEAGAFAVARLLRDAGMEVIYLGRFGLPEAIVEAAIEEGADIIGLSCHSWEYLYYLDELVGLLEQRGLALPVVLGGSVLTGTDEQDVLSRGAAAAFGPGADPETIVARLRELAAARSCA